jgi:hypothetical protein
VYKGFSALSPTWLAAGILAFGLATFVMVRALLRPRARRAPVWVSGSASPLAGVQYTPAAYANPIRVVLAGLYGFRRSVEVHGTPDGARPTARTQVVPAFEEYLYRPLVTGALLASAQARRLQSGRLSLYLLYILIVLLAMLALTPALKS